MIFNISCSFPVKICLAFLRFGVTERRAQVFKSDHRDKKNHLQRPVIPPIFISLNFLIVGGGFDSSQHCVFELICKEKTTLVNSIFHRIF